MLAVLSRELRSYFLTPIGYIFMSLFLLISGIFFAYSNLFTMTSKFAPFLSSIVFIFLLCVPILTMRLMTEEMKQKTDQLLLTSPLGVTEIVLGKFFAAFLFFVITLLITVLYTVIISIYGFLDTWETVNAYIGFVLLGGCFISIGLFISTTTENQVVSAIVTFVVLLVIWIVDLLKQAVPSDMISGIIFAAVLAALVVLWVFFSSRSFSLTILTAIIGVGVIVVLFLVEKDIFLGLFVRALAWISLIERYQDFSMGILKLDAVIYYLSFTGFFLFLTVRLIEKRRWA